ncbi:hypothetical protein I862_02540 [endosymbiont of Acanthamoeba sp. UWC8]|uniref:hypothetical protein n=1 Tax=endosymbiont of Acanthamoeba sp. UWC8 TaxID=86106 RepID=UPI0004D151BB|nr:hypothetical protein [endosymbiont of Acanthamoeba sp. UWC8]AIF81071.1 hypothetical protein I862_02540 [endosymbiont of Acanthamoeba sp. UWC8]
MKNDNKEMKGRIKSPFKEIKPIPPKGITPQEELLTFDPGYVDNIKILRNGSKEDKVDFRSVNFAVRGMLEHIGNEFNNKEGFIQIDFADISGKLRKSRSNDASNYRDAYNDMRKNDLCLTTAKDILNAAVQSIFHERELKINCEYVFDKPGNTVYGLELISENGKIIKEPVFSKDDLMQKVRQITKINYFLDQIEKHEAAIGNCIKDIKNVIGDNRKKSPQELVSGIREIAEKYAKEQKVTPQEMEEIYNKAAQISKNAIKMDASVNNIVIRLMDNIKDLVCSIFGKSAEQKVDKVFTELKQELKDKQPEEQSKGSGRG